VGYKLVEGKGLREGRDSKGLWKSVEELKASAGDRNSNADDLVTTRPAFASWNNRADAPPARNLFRGVAVSDHKIGL